MQIFNNSVFTYTSTTTGGVIFSSSIYTTNS